MSWSLNLFSVFSVTNLTTEICAQERCLQFIRTHYKLQHSSIKSFRALLPFNDRNNRPGVLR